VLALDPGLHRLYVASESGTVAVFDVAGPVRKVAEGNAGPNSHSVAVDPDTHLIYLPLTDVGGRPVLRELVPSWLGAAGQPPEHVAAAARSYRPRIARPAMPAATTSSGSFSLILSRQR
jgi:hypothetical protein